MTALLLPVVDAGAALGIGRTKVYELMATGDLESVTIGRKRLVPADSIEAYVERLKASQGARRSGDAA